ncbi:MAG: hypothetical protein RLZZ161_754, partial [Bacteroidota bacterium]
VYKYKIMGYVSVNDSPAYYCLLDFQNLECWKAASNLKNKLAIKLRGFPSDEKYRLVDQITRASRSVTSNIAEGYGRFHFKDQIRFCITARGSLVELYDHLITSNNENIISSEELKEFEGEIISTGKLLNGYIKYLRSRIKEINE